YVGNIPYSTTSDDLKTIFTEFGEVASARVVMDRESGRSKGFAFVEMNNNDEAKAAMAALDGKVLDDRNLKVNEAKPREERPARRTSGGGNRW
ncbi:MAG: RNA-binding protein, partial [Victivallaceae bacterium]